MYKNVLTILALTALSVPVMAQDAPAPAAPAAPAATASETPVAPAISPEKQAKIEKELTDLETQIINSGIDMSKAQPSADDIAKMLTIVNPFISRKDLEPETVQNLLQMKMMLSMITAKNAADLDTLKTELLAIAANYPSIKSMIEDGVKQMYAEGSQKLYDQLAPLRAQLNAPAPAPAAAPAVLAPAAAATATGSCDACAK